MSAPSVLFYVQHLLGIGHLARASRIAAALAADGFAVTMVTGGAPVPGFPPLGIEHVGLPPVVASEGFSGLLAMDGRPVDEAFRTRRAELLLETLRRLRPDVVVTEAFPFGRRQMRFELLPLLDAVAATTPKPLLAASVRDILQERQKPGRDAETVALLNRHYDLVLVHGDRRFASLGDTFALASAIEPAIAYTGLVAPPAPSLPRERHRVLVSAGGGAAGEGIVQAAIKAAGRLGGRGWALVTGPNLPQAAFEAAAAAAPDGLSLYRFRPDFPSLLAGADLSVSQAGYNTVCDVLRAGCRSVLVPFAAGGETEQTARAERLAALGLASVVGEDGLTGDRLADAIEASLASPQPPATSLDLEGAAGTARMLRAALSG